MPTSTPPDLTQPAPLRAVTQHLRVMLLVLLDMLFSAALCLRRLHRRLPAQPAPYGASWPILSALLLITAPLAQALAGSLTPVHENLVQHALLAAALLAFTPRRWLPLLAIYLCAANGVNLIWAAAGATGALAGVPFGVQASAVLLWQMLAVWAGELHRRELQRH